MANPGQKLDEDVRTAIERLSRDGFTPKEIERRLAADEDFRARVPSDKTIQKYRRGVLAQLSAAAAAPWSPIDSTPAEVALILPVLAEVIERTARRDITVNEAEWIVRIRTVAPDLPLWEAYLVSSTAQDPKGAARVTQYLAFAPWTPAGSRRFRGLAGSGRIYERLHDPHTYYALQKARGNE